jgi:hypothetical protein
VDQLPHPHKTRCQIIVLCSLILIWLNTKREHTKSDLIFFMNAILIYYGRSQIFEL